jgi:hypothetical protein
MNPNEIFIGGSIIFFASGLLVYWGSRVLTLLRASETDLNDLLDADLEVGRQVRLQLRGLFSPSQTFLLPWRVSQE